ncbi:MAG: glycosyltransferase [Alphaproteobacteria bacterium]|nr:glycosyltransferase [Alphaproteobacteria bacterium]
MQTLAEPVTAGAHDKCRIALAGLNGANLAVDQLALIQRLLESGHKVLCLARSMAEEDALALTHLGAEVEEIDLVADRFALMPGRQVKNRIAKTLQKWGAEIVIASGPTVMTAVVPAARKAGAAKIIALAERPRLDTDEKGDKDAKPGKAEDVEHDTDAQLMAAFDAATDILCSNYDDATELELSGLLPEGLRPHVLPGLGVDLQEFEVAELPRIDKGLTFLMVSPMAVSRGVLDFCQAAQIVKEHAPQAEFLLAGPASRTPDAISLADIGPYRETVSYLGDGSNSAELISQCHVFAYPSHGDAHPGYVLEAMAMGRPVITCDAPGCRETVDERVNGCLAAPGNPQAVAAAMESYLKRPDLIPAMSRASRQKAERRYDRRLVLAAYFDLMGLTRAAA